MRVPAGRVWRTVVGVLVALVVVVWTVSYHPLLEFEGGIGISDSGFFSYPRYHIELGHLPLWKAGEYRFIVRGLPPGLLDLVLRVSGGTYSESSELTSLSTTVSVSMYDNSGKEVCAAMGRLSDAKLPGIGSWVLESSSSRAAFWHPRCQQLPSRRLKAYTVRVTVSDVDPHSPQKELTPVLEGGGTELP
jgi:hypothetical protein